MLSILCSMKVNAIAHASDFYQCTMPKFCRHTILLKLLFFQVETFSQQIQFIHSPVLTYSKVMCAKTHVHFITPTKLHAYGFIKGSLKFFGSINVVMLILFTVHCTSAPLMLKSLKEPMKMFSCPQCIPYQQNAHTCSFILHSYCIFVQCVSS